VIVVLGSVVSAIGTIISAIGGVVHAGAGLVGMFGSTSAAAGGAEVALAGTTTAASGLGAAVSGLALPFAAAAAGVTSAALSISAHWGTLKDTFKIYGGLMQAQINQTVSYVKLFATQARISFDSFASSAKSAMSRGMAEVRTQVSSGLSLAKTSFDNFGANARNQINTTMSNISSRTSGAMANIKNSIQSGLASASASAQNSLSMLQSSMTSTWNAIKTDTTNIVNAIKTHIQDNFNGAMKTADDKMTSLKSTAQSTWTDIKNNIVTQINGIKSAIANTVLKFGSVTIPTFSWSGKNDSGKGTTAELKVGTKTVNYASAMAGGAILDKATIFGMSGGNLLRAGEAGKEVVVGANSLSSMIRNSMANSAMTNEIMAIYGLLAEYLPIAASDKSVVLDNGKLVGALTPAINRRLGLMMG
jgi:hypothetical protein